MNRVFIHGKLTRDPELKTVSGGVEACSFTVAVNRPIAKDKEQIADFLPCTAWRQTAAFVSKYFRKGDGIIVEGSLQTRTYEKDGAKRTAFDVNVDRVEFAEKKTGTQTDAAAPAGDFPEAEDDGELPF